VNYDEAVEHAKGLPTMLDALVFMAIWEAERAVKQARTSVQWETCFQICFVPILEHGLGEAKFWNWEGLRDRIAAGKE
jgi:hypothetical protein